MVSPLDSSGPDASSIKRELESLSSKVSDLKTAKEKLLAEKEAEIGRLEADAAGNKECLVDADVKIKQLTDDKDAAQLRINDLVETMKVWSHRCGEGRLVSYVLSNSYGNAVNSFSHLKV